MNLCLNLRTLELGIFEANESNKTQEKYLLENFSYSTSICKIFGKVFDNFLSPLQPILFCGGLIAEDTKNPKFMEKIFTLTKTQTMKKVFDVAEVVLLLAIGITLASFLPA